MRAILLKHETFNLPAEMHRKLKLEKKQNLHSSANSTLSELDEFLNSQQMMGPPPLQQWTYPPSFQDAGPLNLYVVHQRHNKVSDVLLNQRVPNPVATTNLENYFPNYTALPEFSSGDIQTLKSILPAAEKAKWKYVSTQMRHLNYKKASAASCSKKASEILPIPKEELQGDLRSSLPYIVSKNR